MVSLARGNMIYQNRNTILIATLVAAICTSAAGGQTVMILQPAKAEPMVSYSLVPLAMEDLSRQAQLIILGNVSDKQLGDAGLINYTVSIGQIIKGTYAGNTINVLSQPTEFVEDAVDLTKGEKVILFLYKEKMYGGQYAVVGMQGKYDIDSNGVVHGYNINDMSVPDFEKNVTALLSELQSVSHDGFWLCHVNELRNTGIHNNIIPIMKHMEIQENLNYI